MRVFVTGASGWVGSAVVPELVAAGHEVVGLARSDASAAVVAARGAEVVRGGLDDLDVLRAAAAEADGVVHLAFVHDFTDFAAAVATDAAVTAALGEALAGSDKPLVVTSGTPSVPGRIATETDQMSPGSPVAARGDVAVAALALAAQGVRSSVVRLPRSVHGEGDAHGFVPRLVETARASGVSGFIGNGTARWPAVHVADAGVLYRLALEQAPAGSTLHAVGDEGVTVRDIAEAIGRGLDLPVGPVDPAPFGFLGHVFGTDQPASAAATRQLLGWAPTRPGLIADIDAGHYFR